MLNRLEDINEDKSIKKRVKVSYLYEYIISNTRFKNE